jgi:transcriptional regulator with PAS, ATPase and Fis domain/tetratricopeptide (TPR) repeat protein
MSTPTDQSASEPALSSVIVGVSEAETHPTIARAERQYRSGQTVEAIASCDEARNLKLDSESATRVDILHGMALFETGDCVGGIDQLAAAQESARHTHPRLQFAAAFALFIRQADFQSPDDSLIGLSRLRQLATVAGDADSLAGLHFALARLEGYRGLPASAHRHVEIAARFAERSNRLALKCTLDVVVASLEFTAGNLGRARKLSEESLDQARRVGFKKYVIASQANLLAISLSLGDLGLAKRLARDVETATRAMPEFRVGALDTLAQISLHEMNLDRAAELLSECQQAIRAQLHPAPSWYELAHHVTRCAYFERLGDWTSVVELVALTEPEADRRQFRAVRTGLLCSKARALARLGEIAAAEAALASAIRTCPRGAVDPLIVLEASRGLSRTLAGDREIGSAHFDRALAGCRAIGHRYHEAWITRIWVECGNGARAGQGHESSVRVVDPVSTALVLGDVSAVLGAGNSVDLLGHRLKAILEQTTLVHRLQVSVESDRPVQAGSTVDCQTAADGLTTITLNGSDRKLMFRVSHVHTLDEIALVKNIVDLLRAAVRRSGDTDTDDGQQLLWPEVTPAGGDDTVFQSPQMLELLRVAMRLASTDLPILITGETGTGKEVLARFIHDSSRVARGPFAAFNCATMPRELVESQLFGHRRGAFTGALDSFPGVIRAAEHGTLFLDEIGDLEPAVQPKLLRFLEAAEIHPVGEMRPLRVKVRIIAATNASLDTMVENHRFRQDLYYRIGGVTISLPPLRERKDEIPALAALFVERFARECQRREVHLGDDFIAALLLYDWPGNIRQLANEVRRVVAMASDGDTLRSSSLSPEVARPWNVRPTTESVRASVIPIRLDQTLEQATAELERRFMENALAAAGGRVAEAAQLLGLSRKGLFLKRRRRGLVGRHSAR